MSMNVTQKLEGIDREWTENRNGFVDRITGIQAWEGDCTVWIDVFGKRGDRLRGGICLLTENFIEWTKKCLEELGYTVEKKHREWMECPKCHSDNISAQNFDPEASSRLVDCYNCGFQWREVFNFSHNEDQDGCNVLGEDGEPLDESD